MTSTQSEFDKDNYFARLVGNEKTRVSFFFTTSTTPSFAGDVLSRSFIFTLIHDEIFDFLFRFIVWNSILYSELERIVWAMIKTTSTRNKERARNIQTLGRKNTRYFSILLLLSTFKSIIDTVDHSKSTLVFYDNDAFEESSEIEEVSKTIFFHACFISALWLSKPDRIDSSFLNIVIYPQPSHTLEYEIDLFVKKSKDIFKEDGCSLLLVPKTFLDSNQFINTIKPICDDNNTTYLDFTEVQLDQSVELLSKPFLNL